MIVRASSIASGSIATMTAVGAVGLQHRADDPAEHRLAGDVDKAFVGDAAGLSERIEIAAAGGQDEDVGALRGHCGPS